MRILLAQIDPTIGDLEGNTKKIIEGINSARKKNAQIVVFPELALTGYPPDDFLLLPHFIASLHKYIDLIIENSEKISVIVGTPRIDTNNHLYNSAAVISNKKLLGYQDKTLLPTYDVFDERRYFHPAQSNKIWEIDDKKVAITICEDIWHHSAELPSFLYTTDPIINLISERPDVMINLSASPFTQFKLARRIKVCSKVSLSLDCPTLFCNQVGGNDSLLFDGYSFWIDKDGHLKELAKGFQEDTLLIDLNKKNQHHNLHLDLNEMLFEALVMGVKDYFKKGKFTKACLGLSGGIDSALVACIATEALGKENVLGVSMPSRYSSEGSKDDAEILANNLGIAFKTIPIEEQFKSYLDTLNPHFENLKPDITEENLQARIRGVILMALSNKFGYLVLSTGNKSETALGYATLYGDMCGGLAVINDLTKRQVYALSHWINRNKEIIPWNTIQKAPSAELRPNQKDSDSLPDYEIIDNVLECYVEKHMPPDEIALKFNYETSLVNHLIKLIHRNEYKRRQSPPGLRITEKAFSAGRRFPIIQGWV